MFICSEIAGPAAHGAVAPPGLAGHETKATYSSELEKLPPMSMVSGVSPFCDIWAEDAASATTSAPPDRSAMPARCESEYGSVPVTFERYGVVPA